MLLLLHEKNDTHKQGALENKYRNDVHYEHCLLTVGNLIFLGVKFDEGAEGG
jgi:hypothetical protein